MVGDILSLAFLTQHHAPEIHPSCCIYQKLFFPPFLVLTNILLYVYAKFHLNIQLLTDTCVGSTFQLSWIMWLWTLLYKYLCPFSSLGYIARSEIAASDGISMFTFLRNYHTLFHNGCCHFLQSHYWGISVLISPQPFKHIFFSFINNNQPL